MASIVADIANASIEQSTGIEQVNKTLTQMDEVTQQNSALVEENAATAKTLEHQAKSMDNQVAFFKIDTAAGAEGMSHASVPTATAVASKTSPQDAKVIPYKAVLQRPVKTDSARRVPVQLASAVEQAAWKEF